METPSPDSSLNGSSPNIEETMDSMAQMLAKFLLWLAPEGQYTLRIRLLVHFLKRVKYYTQT